LKRMLGSFDIVSGRNDVRPRIECVLMQLSERELDRLQSQLAQDFKRSVCQEIRRLACFCNGHCADDVCRFGAQQIEQVEGRLLISELRGYHIALVLHFVGLELDELPFGGVTSVDVQLDELLCAADEINVLIGDSQVLTGKDGRVERLLQLKQLLACNIEPL